MFDASYLVLGLGDVYLGAPVATPLDPRHRLVTTKYNPARTWTPENSVGIGGAYLCIYGMEGPGGYQFVGRTVQVWNRRPPARTSTSRGCCDLRPAPLVPGRRPTSCSSCARDRQPGELPIEIEETTFRLGDHRSFLADARRRDRRLPRRQQAAFAAERRGLGASGEFDDGERRTHERPADRRSPRRLLDRIAAPTAGDGIWIAPGRAADDADAAARRAVDERRGRRRATLPLAGTTLAVKDNIDVAGLPTTAGCPAFAYVPDATPPRGRARGAGAVVVGKTNLDQFATGLVGTRSPYGICPNAHWPGLVAGGSSSGSAVAVAARAGRPRPRHRHRRVGTGAGRVQRHRRAQADPRPDQRPPASCPPAGRSTACRCSPARSSGRPGCRAGDRARPPPTRGAGAARSDRPPGRADALRIGVPAPPADVRRRSPTGRRRFAAAVASG